MGVSRQRQLLNNSEVEMHDWCGTFHFHTFKRSLLAPAPNRPSGLCSSKPGMDLAFLVVLSGTRVALFWGTGTSGGGWDSTPVFAPYPIIESCSYFELGAQSASLMRGSGLKNLGSQFDVAGKPEGLQISPAGCSYTQEHMSLKHKHFLNRRSISLWLLYY